MHHLYYLAIFPATGLTVAGYLTLYCAKRSEGGMRTAGRILSAWAFLLAIMVAAMAVIHPAIGERPFGHFGHMDGAPMLDQGAPGGQAAPSAPEAPTPPAPDAKPDSQPGTPTANPSGWKTN